MTKKLTKDAQIAALTETNASLGADVLSLSEAVGELEAEIVTERATAAAKVAEAQAKVRDALAMAAGDAATALMEQVEGLKAAARKSLEAMIQATEDGNAEIARLKEALGWAERSRDEMEAEMEKVGAHWRGKAEAAEAEADDLREKHKEEIDGLEEKHEKALEEVKEEAKNDADLSMETLRAELDGYLADLGYPRDPHPSTISCPHLRRLVAATDRLTSP